MSSSNLRMPILETGNLCHLMIIDLIGYITLTIASGAFCGVKYKCVRMLRKQESPDASTHALILITGMSIFINGIIRMAACFTYMAIQYSSLTPSSPHVEDYLMAPLYFEELGFLVFFCTFAYLIFSWWHIVGGLKRRVHDYTVTQLVYYALGILGVMALLLVPSIALMPVRWNSDVFFYAWMWSILAPIALLSIVTAAAVAFLGYRMVRKARKASKGNKITSKRLIIFVTAFSLGLLFRIVGLPFIAASTGTEDFNYNLSQLLFVLLPDIIPSGLYLYIQSRAHYIGFTTEKETEQRNSTLKRESQAQEENIS